MNLVSVEYFFSVVALIIIYYVIPKNFRWILLLLLSCLWFIITGGLFTLFYMLVFVAIAFIGAKSIENTDDPKYRKISLFSYISIIILGLFYSKIVFPLIEFNNPIFKILVPVGILYYTLSTVGYLIECYLKIIKAERNFFKLALFISYFPLLTSGPIIKYSQMKEELFNKRPFDYDSVKLGLIRIIWGCFKNIVVAERLHNIVANIYQNYPNYSGSIVLLGILLTLLELYMNFSGCMDIVIGTSETLGIKLPENFKSPFCSKSVSEYFRRWHITLGDWFKNFVFYPILNTHMFKKLLKSKNPVLKQLPIIISLIILWGLTGIWHGTTIKLMICSGLIPCTYMIIEILLTPFANYFNKKFKKLSNSFIMNSFRMIRTFVLMSFCTMFFFADSFTHGFNLIKKAFDFNNFLPMNIITQGIIDKKDLIAISIFVVFVLLITFLQEKGYKIREILNKQFFLVQWIILTILILTIAIFGEYGPGYNPSDFIYGNF